MIRRISSLFIIILIIVGVFTSCQNNKTCASAVSELIEMGCTPKQLSQAMNIPVKNIKNAQNYSFSEADSIFLFSLLSSYKETGKLPENLYQLYNKNKYNHSLYVIENFRQEEIKSNEVFINNLYEQIINTQNDHFNKFIEGEVNSFKALRFIGKSQEEINQSLSDALPNYMDEIKIAKLYNDSCASYFNYISRFRSNGIKRYITNISPNNHLNTIDTDIRGFIPEYEYENSSSNIIYQVLATIERAQDVLFAPINWILELLPVWLMIVIAIILLIIFIISIYTGQFHVSVIDAILLIISIIVLVWGDPYSEIRESTHDQIREYYKTKIGDELNHLNLETNKYYDNCIEILNSANRTRSSRKYAGMQTSVKTNDRGDNRENIEKDYEGSDRTGNESNSEVFPEANSDQRDETIISKGN